MSLQYMKERLQRPRHCNWLHTFDATMAETLGDVSAKLGDRITYIRTHKTTDKLYVFVHYDYQCYWATARKLLPQCKDTKFVPRPHSFFKTIEQFEPGETKDYGLCPKYSRKRKYSEDSNAPESAQVYPDPVSVTQIDSIQEKERTS